MCRSSRAFVFTAVTLCLVCYIAVSSVLGPRLRYSPYYEYPQLSNVLREEHQRADDATRWMQSFQSPAIYRPTTTTAASHVVTGKRFCVAVLTAPRGELRSRYLDHAIHSLFASLDAVEWGSIYSLLVARGTDVNTFPSPLAQSMFNHVHLITSSSSVSSSMLREESHDYEIALQLCLERTDAQFVVVLEDDISCGDHFVHRLCDVIRNCNTRPLWMVTKLFHHEYWQGFDWQNSTLIAAAVVVSVFASSAFIVVQLRKSKRRALEIAMTVLFVSVCVGFVTGWSMYNVGRQHLKLLLPSKAGLKPYIESSTVATLFNATNRTNMNLLLKYLNAAEGGLPPIDLMIDDWLKGSLFESFVYSPSLVQHVSKSHRFFKI
jgi:hypothetical protein